ncbi:MAG: acyl-CoA dehydrogenase family protein [Actinomycetota bacterium]|nr:acyl-CoA dehydrogenase family protein [Actinomycetota bacterium]
MDAGVIERARSVVGLAAANADEAERSRRLPAATVKALVDAELMRLCVPPEYGGPGVDPMTLMAAVETVAKGDGAAAWCSMIASTTSSLSLMLPPETARTIFEPPSAVAGGVFAPNGTARLVDDGFRVSGRWQWGSGTQHCDWIVGGARCDDGTFRLCWFPAADVEFHDTWYTSGMRGTGSLDYSVDDLLVIPEFTTQPGATRPVVDNPLANFPMFALLAVGIAGVALGIARHALDELVALATDKRPQYASRSLAEQPYTQIEVSRAEAQLRGGRALLLDELASTWDVASAGGHIDVSRRVAVRLAANHATECAVTAVDSAYTLAGGTSVYSASVLQRCLRDVHTATQHVMVAPKLHATLGRSLLGLDIDTSML